MKKIVENIKKQVFDNFGKRIIDGKCAFCGKELNGSYCDCSESLLVNRYYKRAWKKIEELEGYEVINEDYESALKKFVLPSIKTPRKFQGMTFKHYHTENESQKRALDGILEYRKNAVMNYLTGTNLILFGNYGTGKTMLMSILCDSLAKDYLFKGLFVNLVDFINEVKDTFNNSNNKTAKKTLENYRTAEFLFLDDIDKAKPSDYARELFYSLINYRTENELPTIVSANHSPEELDSSYYDEAVVSRLADISNSRIIKFSHQNKRLGG